QALNAFACLPAVDPAQAVLLVQMLAVVIAVVVGDVELGRVAPGDFERAAIDEARDRDRFPVPLQTNPPGHGHSPGAKATFIPIDSNSTASCAGSALGISTPNHSAASSTSASENTLPRNSRALTGSPASSWYSCQVSMTRWSLARFSRQSSQFAQSRVS